MDLFLIFLIVACIILGIFLFFLLRRLSVLEAELRSLAFSKASQSVKYGKTTEQLIPFAKDFPFGAENFRFLGSPIDGVVFEPDRIVFAEFKTSTSQLSEKQRAIKELVKQKKVEWFEYRAK